MVSKPPRMTIFDDFGVGVELSLGCGGSFLVYMILTATVFSGISCRWHVLATAVSVL